MKPELKDLLDNAETVIAGARQAAKVPDDSFWIELDQLFNGGHPEDPKIEPRQVREGQ
jgi:hypothetical protein